MKQQIQKCLKKQKKAARAAMSCLVLLLLYGCANQSNRAQAVSLLPESDVLEDAQEDDPAVFDGGQAEGSAEGEQTPDTYAVYICGAVKCPGVYELSAGSRVYEAITMAGGLTKDASETAVNQAQLLVDGQMIQIPTKEEAEALQVSEDAAEDGLVNINTADLEELKTLPGIGDAKAQSIISYRESNGAFEAIEDIKKIEGIKDGVFAKLEGLIKVD